MYTWNSFGSDGAIQSVTYTIEGTNVSYSGTQITGGKQYKIRGNFVFAPDLTSNVGKFEMSVDGKTWMPSGEIRNKIVRSPLK